jgi:GT2 family glycosyltransferase
MKTFIPQPISPDLLLLNKILQIAVDRLLAQQNINLADYALQAVHNCDSINNAEPALQITMPLLRNKKIHWTWHVNQANQICKLRFATAGRINHCHVIIELNNVDIQHHICIDGKNIQDNSWVICSPPLAVGSYQVCLYSPDADNANNTLFLWLTMDFNSPTVILLNQYGLQAAASFNAVTEPVISQIYPLINNNILQWQMQQEHYQAINTVYLKLGTGDGNNSGELKLTIFDLDWQLIAEAILPANQVIDGAWSAFRLNSPVAANNRYHIQLQAINPHAEHAIFVYLCQLGLVNYNFIEIKQQEKNNKIVFFAILPDYVADIKQLNLFLTQLAQQYPAKIIILQAGNYQDIILAHANFTYYAVNAEHSLNYIFERLLPTITEEFCVFLTANQILNTNQLWIGDADFIYADNDFIGINGQLFAPNFKSKQPYTANFNTMASYNTAWLRQLSLVIDNNMIDFAAWLLSRLKNIFNAHQISNLALISQSFYQLQLQQQLQVLHANLLKHKPRILHRPQIAYHQIPNYPLALAKSNTELKLIRTEKVSIIIPNKDLASDLNRCIDSIIQYTSYPNWEIIIVDNGSTQPETLALYHSYSNKLAQRFKVIKYAIPFNFSLLVNLGVKKASGEIILLLNNDTQIYPQANWLEKMLAMAQKPEIAGVGCKLIYPHNHTIQHAGIICGLAGIANHGHRNNPMYSVGYQQRLMDISYYSAITGACLMIKKSLWQQVGGFERSLAVAFNDVDFGLKLTALGYKNVLLPDVYIYHHESKSRGLEITPSQQQRLARETQFMRQRWGSRIEQDPYYSPHLTTMAEDFSLSSKSIYWSQE